MRAAPQQRKNTVLSSQKTLQGDGGLGGDRRERQKKRENVENGTKVGNVKGRGFCIITNCGFARHFSQAKILDYISEEYNKSLRFEFIYKQHIYSS